MVFKDLNEFGLDLTEKILAFISTGVYDYNRIVSVIKGYLHEIKHIKEIDDFTLEYKNNHFDIILYKETVHKKLSINPKNELRKRKINIIKDNT